MNIEELRKYWETEEQKAHIVGLYFWYIENRFESEENSLPWDLSNVISKYRKNNDILLDIDTGGGEFLLSLGHPYELACATEGFSPNVELCWEEPNVELAVKILFI